MTMEESHHHSAESTLPNIRHFVLILASRFSRTNLKDTYCNSQRKGLMNSLPVIMTPIG